MAGRTHGQHALPVTFGFKAAVWLDELLRHAERLRQARPRVLVGEFGGAVGTLASLGREGLMVQKELMSRLGLGVAAIPVKTAGDRFAEFAVQLGMLSATVGKIAQNIYNLQQTDIDEVTEFTDGKVGSSAMPHKQNPVASGSVVFLGRLLRSNIAPALDYIHAEWEDDHRQGETAWKFVPEVCLLADAQLALLDRVLSHIIVKKENMERNLERAGGFVCSEAPVDAARGRHRKRSRPRDRQGAVGRGAPQRDVVLRRGASAPDRARAPDEGADRGLRVLPRLSRRNPGARQPRARALPPQAEVGGKVVKRLSAAALLLAGCASPPTAELELADARVERARRVEAPLYAPEGFARAEAALAQAHRLAETADSYLEAVRRAGDAVGLADDAARDAATHKKIVERHAARCVRELEALLSMSQHGGAESDPEFAALAERYRSVRATAEAGDLLGALDQGRALKPELLALEMRFR